jgi:hypothetical protein
VPHSKQLLVPLNGVKLGIANTPPGPKCSLLFVDNVTRFYMWKKVKDDYIKRNKKNNLK